MQLAVAIALSLLLPRREGPAGYVDAEALLPSGALAPATLAEVGVAAHEAGVPSDAVAAASVALRLMNPSVSAKIKTWIGFDETDIDGALYTSKDGKYTWGGDLDLRIIGCDDPSPLERKHRELVQALDGILQGKCDDGAMQDAIEELECGVPDLRAALVKARGGLSKKLALYEKRNKRQALGSGKGSSTNAPVAAASEATKPPPAAATARAAALLADRSSVLAGAEKSMAAGKLLNHRFVERKDEEGSIRGVVKLRPADDSGEVQLDVKWTGVKDTEILDWAALQCPPDAGCPALVPFTEYTLEELTRLPRDAILEEIKARKLEGITGKTKAQLVELLFFHLRGLKDQADTYVAIESAHACGELDDDERDVAEQQANELAAADEAAARDEAAEDKAAAGKAAAGDAPAAGDEAGDQAGEEQQAALEAQFKGQQITELMAQQALVDAATRRLRSVQELLRDCRVVEYAVDAGLLVDEEEVDESPMEEEVNESPMEVEVEELDDDALARSFAARVIERALAQNPLAAGSSRLLALATRTRAQVSELFEGRRTAADKLFAFMIGDHKHRCAFSVARFAVTASMKSDQVDALVTKVSSDCISMEEELDLDIEKCDGAATMLIREVRSTVRSSARAARTNATGEASVTDERERLPRSARETSLETNAALENWEEETERSLHEKFEAAGTPQHIKSGANKGDRSSRGAVFKRAMKQEMSKIALAMALREAQPHYPDLHGWVHKPYTGQQYNSIFNIKLRGEPTNRLASQGSSFPSAFPQPTAPASVALASARAFEERVLEAERKGNRDPASSALRGALFNEQDIQDAGFRDLVTRMTKLRLSLPKIVRPLPEKMADSQRTPAAMRAWLSMSVMPTSPTPLLANLTLAESILKPLAVSVAADRAAATNSSDNDDAGVGTAPEERQPPPRARAKTTSTTITLRRENGSLGIAVNEHKVISAVHSGGAGEKAGLLVADEIVEVNGKDAGTSTIGSLLPKRADAPITLRLRRTEASTVAHIKPSAPQPLGAASMAVEAAAASSDKPLGDSSATSSEFISPSMMTWAAEMYDAVADDDVTPFDMMVELRVMLNDRCRWELAKFHGMDLRSQMLFREGHWLYQCPSHKYKRVIRQLVTFLKDEKEEAHGRFSMRRLLRVNRELAAKATSSAEHAKHAAIDSVLTGGTDMHSQAAHIYVLLCPPLLAELEKRPDCNPEYVTLKVLGMAWLGWDMGNLTDLERIRRIELVEALFLYNVGGEQLFYPFYDETAKKQKGSKGVLVGILSQHVGIFSTQNVCALLQNGAVHRQRRQQNPLEMFIEKCAPNNELESFFSQVAIHGYKPRLMELQVCRCTLSYCTHNRARCCARCVCLCRGPSVYSS